MANDKTREIAINFQTNVSSTIDQLRALQSTLDENSVEYEKLSQQIELTEKSLRDYDDAISDVNSTEKLLTKTKQDATKVWEQNDKIINNYRGKCHYTKEIISEIKTFDIPSIPPNKIYLKQHFIKNLKI